MTTTTDVATGWESTLPAATFSRRRVASALFVVNQPSGDGRTAAELQALREAFHFYFGPVGQRYFVVTTNHEDASRLTQAFLKSFSGPWLLIAGGGSGTQRALVQGVMAEVEKGNLSLDQVQVSGLRLGSGNIIPRYFDLPRDPLVALRYIADDLFSWHKSPCCVYRCTAHYPDGDVHHAYGMTMAGIGHFGHVPEDVEQWRERHPWIMSWLRRRWPREEINTYHYIGASLIRAASCLIQPQRALPVVVRQNDYCRQFRLFAGLLVNFDFPQLPFATGCALGEPRLALCLIPWQGRQLMAAGLRDWRRLGKFIYRYEITPGRPLEIRFAEDEKTVLALDEDVFVAPSRIRFSVAGLIDYVTGVLPEEVSG